MKYEITFPDCVPGVAPQNGALISVSIKTPQDQLKKYDYTYMDKYELYSLIDSHQSVNLDNCYVAGFSLKEYRELRNMDDKVWVDIYQFSAINAFFDTYQSYESVANITGGVDPNEHGYNEIDFSMVRFYGWDVVFSDSYFGNGKVNFYKADFGSGQVFFTGVRFGNGNIDFDCAHFGNGNVSFEGVEFGRKGKVNFSNATFGEGNIYFVRTRFPGKGASFYRTKFGDANLYFYDTTLGKEMLFSQTDFGLSKVRISSIGSEEATVVFDNCSLIGDYDLHDLKCKALSFKNCTIRGVLLLEGIEADNLCFSNSRNLGHIYIRFREDLLIERLLTDIPKKDFLAQLVMLKENFHTIGRYDDEDAMYLAFKRYQWRNELEEIGQENWLRKIFKYLVHWSYRVVADCMGGYGTKPQNVAVSIFVIFIICTLVLVLNPEWICKSDNNPITIIDCVSYSVATFLTIGYGNITPRCLVGVIMSAVEGLSGVFLVAYFTVAYARKLLR